MLFGMATGVISASFFGTPFDVVIVRMTADGRAPVHDRRNYRNVFDALFRITKEEGIMALWRGTTPTIARSMIVQAAQLSTYSQSRQKIMEMGIVGDGILCYLLASLISGVATSTASLPADNIKTKIQNMRVLNGGQAEYSGIFDVLRKTIRNDGVLSLWRGFTPFYLRQGQQIMLTFIFLEELCTFYSKSVLRQDYKEITL